MTTPTTDRPAIEAAKPLATGAIALVVITTLLFWAIGMVRGDDTSLPGITDGFTTATDETPATDDGTTPEGTPGEGEDGTTAPVIVEGEGAPALTEDGATPEAVAPTGLSVQVLDAVLDDGGAAAKAVAQRLEDAGYDVVVINKAVRVYDKTTVFYVGSDASNGEATAKAFGFTVVEPKPDNLSSSVDLHVVVGVDQR